MAKKQDSFYFENFVSCVDYASRAAAILNDTFLNFKPEELENRLHAIHQEEHGADCKKHDLMEALARAFITPIEREDIMLLSQNIDELVDKIEDVLIRCYCNNVQSIRPDAQKICAILVEGCGAVKDLMVEFANFKRSKTLKEKIIRINTLEEDADKLFIAGVRDLHVNCKDPLVVYAWHEVYIYLEQCVDACEHIADIVESVVMKNS